MLRLLCDPNPMAFGSTSALLAVLDHLPAGAVHVTAIAAGVQHNLLAGETRVDTLVTADPKDSQAVRASVCPADHNAVLVVSNRSNLDWYLDQGLPVFFIDILGWYGSRKSGRVRARTQAWFVERFLDGCTPDPELEDSNPAPLVVGPLVRSAPVGQARDDGRAAVLVNIGGATNRWIRPGHNSRYLSQVLAWIADIRHLLPPGPILVAAGSEAVAAVRDEVLPGGVAVETLPQHAYLQHLAACSVFVTAPGLNAVFEALYARKPMVFLPPQNASQVEQLAVYERCGLVERGVNLPALIVGFPEAGCGVPEGVMTAAVLDGLRTLDGNPRLRELVLAHLTSQLSNLRAPERVEARRDAIRLLGAPGGVDVAETISSWWRERGGG